MQERPSSAHYTSSLCMGRNRSLPNKRSVSSRVEESMGQKYHNAEYRQKESYDIDTAAPSYILQAI